MFELNSPKITSPPNIHKRASSANMHNCLAPSFFHGNGRGAGTVYTGGNATKLTVELTIGTNMGDATVTAESDN